MCTERFYEKKTNATWALFGQVSRMLWCLESHIGSDSEESAGKYKKPGFDLWVRKIPWRREWQSTPVFLPGEFHGRRSLAAYGPGGHKELDMTEGLTLWLLSPSSLKARCYIWQAVSHENKYRVYNIFVNRETFHNIVYQYLHLVNTGVVTVWSCLHFCMLQYLGLLKHMYLLW